MPIYEYRCQSCNHDLEVMQKLSDPELSDCPSCGQPQLKKLISAVGFRLKGSGWYETDFKKGNQKNVAKDEAPASAPCSASTSAGDSGGGCAACPAAA
ncbi:MAG TPA: FmdB family transcriptional regulator [Gammaproteobacteria bacterium]|nr:FmdB family transcriptional regulator [Gammaproteobacteria bacterium]